MKRAFSLYDDLPPETAGAGAKAPDSTSSASTSVSSSTQSDPAAQPELNSMAQRILRLQQAKAKLKKSTALLQAKNAASSSSSSSSTNTANNTQNSDEKSTQSASSSATQQPPQPKVYKVAASSNLLLSDLGYGAEEMVIDPYDPATPNDYSEYARNRSEVKRREKLMRRAAKREKKSEVVLNLHITAEEAYLNRARMSGKTITELPPPQLLPSQEKALSSSTTTASSSSDPAAAQNETVPMTPETDLKSLIDPELDGVPWFPDNDIIETLRMQRAMRHRAEKYKKRKGAGAGGSKKPDGVGAKIMEKMGWRDGMGLGRQEQGMTAPLVAVRDRDNASCGEIVAGTESSGRVILCLTNMIAVDELDDSFDKEVKDECSKYGNVVSVTTKVWNDSVKVFVRFEDEKAAALGLDSLDGRIFGGRKVQVKYYSVSSFDSGDYSL